ncbi:hypothetical protein L596_020489 [Steinernema carpocapsae]|uniref:Uncharacterized protein n=1 Tax=Steinernema carpocapsae TaxID=34508 RepID=A0A4V6A0Y1_STECR|nr:hypothetical protein L596_020489 [Steinernema carpocapsae]
MFHLSDSDFYRLLSGSILANSVGELDDLGYEYSVISGSYNAFDSLLTMILFSQAAFDISIEMLWLDYHVYIKSHGVKDSPKNLHCVATPVNRINTTWLPL